VPIAVSDVATRSLLAGIRAEVQTSVSRAPRMERSRARFFFTLHAGAPVPAQATHERPARFGDGVESLYARPRLPVREVRLWNPHRTYNMHKCRGAAVVTEPASPGSPLATLGHSSTGLFHPPHDASATVANAARR
jgi:hypothetical protein